MSRTLVVRLLATGLLAGGFLCGHFALAGAASLEDLLTGALTPSAAAPLLGPISSVGRNGWECKPERAARSSGWAQAELPADSDIP